MEHRPITSAIKMLGSMMCPSGNNAATLDPINHQGQEWWVDLVISGRLSRRNAWFMLDRQRWPHLGFRICNYTAMWEDLEWCLHPVYWQLAPRGGVRSSNCTTPTTWSSFLQNWVPAPRHWVPPGPNPQAVSPLWLPVWSRNPNVSYTELLFTDYFITITPGSICKVQKMGHQHLAQVDLGEGGHVQDHGWDISLPIDPPQEGDEWFVQAAMEAGVTNPAKLVKQNWFQCHQQVLYVSDILDSGGKCFDKGYLLFPYFPSWEAPAGAPSAVAAGALLRGAPEPSQKLSETFPQKRT